MWEKVVLNLLSNALKFTFDGSITVRVRREDNEAIVTVADTGIGVAPDESSPALRTVPPHRVRPRAVRTEGSGIGLALVQELVDLHGGTITAESTEVRAPLSRSVCPSAHRTYLPTPSDRGRHPLGVRRGRAGLQEALRWIPGDDVDVIPSRSPSRR